MVNFHHDDVQRCAVSTEKVSSTKKCVILTIVRVGEMREEWLVNIPRNNEEHSSFLRQASSFCSAAFGTRGSELCLKLNVQSHGMRSTWFELMCILIPVVQCHTGYRSTDVIYCAHKQQKLGMGIYVAILLYRTPRYFVFCTRDDTPTVFCILCQKSTSIFDSLDS